MEQNALKYVTVLGGVNMDIQGFPKHKLIAEDSNIGTVKISLGGVGRNIGENLVRLGINTKLISVLGDDVYGCITMLKDNIENSAAESLDGQKWAGKSAAVFYYTAIPYRSEWRYTISAHKLILLDAGHVVQNLYIGCGAIGCGTCAAGDYDQALCDKLLQIDGKDEFVVYAAPVGVI